MSSDTAPPRLSLGHATVAVRDLDLMVDFYRDVLGFHVTNRGPAGDGITELAFLCQDPDAHHQIVLVSGMPTPEHQFVLADHLAFRTGTLDDLRLIGERLAEAGLEDIIPISHGNAWSLYFNDPEGNGLECFVDSPFHVAQPYATGVDLTITDEEIEASTRAEIESLPEFQPFDRWKADFATRLANPPTA
ncbi:MAG TPA: VOC family protein [Acidimicrobiales bacterium]|nr:VOC family protein [Acidimicrobiales bacterium]